MRTPEREERDPVVYSVFSHHNNIACHKDWRNRFVLEGYRSMRRKEVRQLMGYMQEYLDGLE